MSWQLIDRSCIIVGEAGEFTFVSEWKEHEIAFHVAPMMPLTKNDDQQVLRKRYIGNGKSYSTRIQN